MNKNYFYRGGMAPGFKHTLMGIEGHISRKAGPAGLWESQVFLATREFKGKGEVFSISIRYDRGHVSNKQNSFAMTRDFGGVTGPLGDEECAEFWPELLHLVQWHCSSEGVPMHYLDNSLYHGAQGKADAARRAANWPDAPDNLVLGAPNKFELELNKRLPWLQEQFFSALKATGLQAYP